MEADQTLQSNRYYTLDTSLRMAECLLILGRPAESRPYFGQAYALLSQDIWLVAQEKERLERLKRLAEEPELFQSSP